MNFHAFSFPACKFQVVSQIEPYTYPSNPSFPLSLSFSCDVAKCPLRFQTVRLGKTGTLALSKYSPRNFYRYDKLNPAIYLKKKTKKNTLPFISGSIRQIYYFILSDKLYTTPLYALHQKNNFILGTICRKHKSVQAILELVNNLWQKCPIKSIFNSWACH